MCSKCNKLFLGVERFERHVKFVHSRAYYVLCEFCGKQLVNRTYLRRHCEIKHMKKDTVEKYSICEVCGKQILCSGGSDLKRHLQMHAGYYVLCEFCGRKFSGMKYLYKHREIHHHCVKTGKQP